MLTQLTDLIAEYQALTGQEGQHIDELHTLITCLFVRSKSIDMAKKSVIRDMVLERIRHEIMWCKCTFNFESTEVMTSAYHLIENT
ncbi:hypothetical protein GCE9029_03619 [Grimontia celer]|uniref:Uncharacterized protein n=1 Tax=Grimontia celer TaxID=1796497 RepID=A0A128F9W1_9GAMM|nr:hypothetical protein GCE9029_03619 [Grimontia celer]